MSLVTRCPACATPFTVVRDQLRISDGWVRCGRCSQVFDAMLDLQEQSAQDGGLEPDAADAAEPSLEAADAPGEVLAAAQAPDEPEPDELGELDEASASPDPVVPSWTFDFSQAPSLDLGLEPEPPPAAAEPEPAPAIAPPVAALPQASLQESFAALTDFSASVARTAAEAQSEKVLRRRRLEAVQQGRARRPVRPPVAPVAKDLPPTPTPTPALPNAGPVLLRPSTHGMSQDSRRVEEAALPVPPLVPGLVQAASPPDRPRRSEARSSAAAGKPTVVRTPSKPSTRAPVASPTSSLPSFARAAAPAQTQTVGALSRHPGLGIALALLLVLLLVLQVLRQERDSIAARHPGWAPTLNALCKLSGCSLAAPRDMAAIPIEGASFVHEPGADGLNERFRLSFTLRNDKVHALAMPAVELTLLDAQARTVLRRVLLPADFGAPDAIAGQGEHHASLPLALDAQQGGALAPVVGYGLVAFYP